MKHTINGWLTWRKEDWNEEPEISFYPFDVNGCASFGVPIREHSFEVEIPDGFDARRRQVSALNEEKEKLRVDFAMAQFMTHPVQVAH